MIEFSVNQPDKNKKYIRRPGAYGIITNTNNFIALIKTKTGYFFTCKIDKFLNTKTEKGHKLIWMKPEEAIPLLYLNNQKEAVRIFKLKDFN
jgi:hypothetical protein